MAVLADAAQTINRLAADGALPVRIAEVLPLARAAEAHRLVAGATGRKLRDRIFLSVRDPECPEPA